MVKEGFKNSIKDVYKAITFELNFSWITPKGYS